MKNLLADALRTARADHAEIRLERTWATAIAYRGSRLEGATTGLESGAMARCLNRGRGWGVASCTGLTGFAALLSRAHELSLAVPVESPIALAEIPVRTEDHLADLDGDVRGVPLGEKRALLERLNQEILSSDRRIVDTHVSYEDRVTERWFATSDGVFLYEIAPSVRLAAGVLASEEGFVERAFESWATRGGWRSVQSADNVFRTAARRAVALLSAPRIKAGLYPMVLDPRCMGALIHQGIGHLSEADALDERADVEARFPLGKRIGSDLLTVGDDGSASSLPGSRPFDDEGAPTQNTLLVQHGVLVGRLHTRATAGRIGRRPTGNARAGSFREVPEARLTNTYIANGRGTAEDLIRDVRHGLYCCDAMGGEMRHGHFSLRTGYAQVIRDGQLTDLARPPVIMGDLSEILGRLDAVAGDFRWNQQASLCARAHSGRVPVCEGAPHVRLDGAPVAGDAT
ncbi:MAG TPA: TldD/PmbA family protein [Gemmatimonadales bacterium]|nr:TldD/PmbA family protein [Gemmatimonadales bacterium]